MRTNLSRNGLVALAVGLLAATLDLSASAQGSGFTYQGRLTDNGNPHTGTAEIQFTLWDALTNGNQVAATSPTVTTVTVTDGLFRTSIDFGAAAFNGQPRFLQLEVRTGLTPFALIAPRQAVTATPYAMRALTVASNGLSGGTYANPVNFNNAGNSFSGAFTGDGSSLSNVNVATLGGLGASDLWKVGGNSGTTAGVNFLGTTDNQPLELRANNQRGLRLEPNASTAPNLIGGSPRNFVGAGAVGATISGGGAVSHSGDSYTNSIQSDFGTVGGGRNNRINTNAPDSAIGGGTGNVIGADSFHATIAGGSGNNIGRNSSGAFMGGGGSQISANSSYATVGGGQSHFIATNANWSFIGGGYNNAIFGGSQYAAVAGGRENDIGVNADFSFIGGGISNLIGLNSTHSVIPGGIMNEVAANAGFSLAAGRRAKANHFGSFIWADATDADYVTTGQNQVRFRAGGGMFVEGATDASLASGGFITMGSAAGLNVAMDNNEIMARNNGAASPLTINASGGNVAINRLSPATSLHVGGTIRADDNLQAGGAITYLNPPTRYLSLSGIGVNTLGNSALSPAGFFRTAVWDSDFGDNPGTAIGAGDINLPHGAIITRLTAHLVDSAATAGWTVRLLRVNLGGGNGEPIASVVSIGSPGLVSLTTTSITAPLVINDTYAYFFALYGRGGPVDGTLSFRGLVIEYTVSSPAP